MISYGKILAYKWPGNQWRIDGDDYSTLWWSADNRDPKPTEEEIESSVIEVDLIRQWIDIRRLRDDLLKASDWTQLKDSPKKDQTKWKKYRQELRDITEKFDDPDFVIWPDSPETK